MSYTPPSHDNVDLILHSGYGPPGHTNVDLALGEVAKTLTVDVVIQKTQPGSLIADAAFKVAQSASITADAFFIPGVSVTADAVLKGTQLSSATADAALKGTQSSSITADGVLLKTTSGSLSADAVLLQTQADSFAADACLTSAAVSPKQYLFTQAGPVYLPIFPVQPISVSVTSDHAADYRSIIFCDATSGSLTVTLPSATGNLDKCYTIKHTSGSHSVVIDGNGADIDESATQTLSEYDAKTLACDGSAWWITGSI